MYSSLTCRGFGEQPFGPRLVSCLYSECHPGVIRAGRGASVTYVICVPRSAGVAGILTTGRHLYEFLTIPLPVLNLLHLTVFDFPSVNR